MSVTTDPLSRTAHTFQPQEESTSGVSTPVVVPPSPGLVHAQRSLSDASTSSSGGGGSGGLAAQLKRKLKGMGKKVTSLRRGSSGSGSLKRKDSKGKSRGSSSDHNGGSNGVGSKSPSTYERELACTEPTATCGTDGAGNVKRQSASLTITQTAPSPDSDAPHLQVPALIQQGTPMTKVSSKKRKIVIFRINPDEGCIAWESKKAKMIPLENIREIRSGADGRYYREQFQLSQDYEDRWFTIVYVLECRYKQLHIIASSSEVFQMWDFTLHNLHAVRKNLMTGLGNLEERQLVWEKRYWKGADDKSDDKLKFEEVEKMCKRLNIYFPQDKLKIRFKEADVENRGYLDFDNFRIFMKALKERPEVTSLFNNLISKSGVFDFQVFQTFMRVYQKSSLSTAELEVIFRRHSGNPTDSPITSPSSLPDSSVQTSDETPTSNIITGDNDSNIQPHRSVDISKLTLTLESFTSFLLSVDNSVFIDHHGRVYHDMSRPLPDYYISSSHNTYLIGHQLVGSSTIEGYIRALLHSCRTVEIDIFDGETEPAVYHKLTLTTKVPLRDICEAIAKYAFVASPYPIIISAEVHCNLAQQVLIAKIMRETFGDSLVAAPVNGRPKFEVLPSPEDLKGKVLFKAYNRSQKYQPSDNAHDEVEEEDIFVESSAEASPYDSEYLHEGAQGSGTEGQSGKFKTGQILKEFKDEVQKLSTEPMKEIKEEIRKSRKLVDRVRRRSPSPGINRSATSPSLTASPPKLSKKRSGSGRKTTDEIAELLVYAVNVHCRGLNKKEYYAPEHMFSLSEKMANKVMKQSIHDLVKHNKSHIVRVYPNATRMNSSNYEPHKYWCTGAQLVALNWQTFDLGYVINHAMFQRNGRSGYVLKPLALRTASKELLSKRSNHVLEINVISAQQLPRPKNSSGQEVIDSNAVDPYVEVTIHVPDWTRSPFLPSEPVIYSPASSSTSSGALSQSPSSARAATQKTSVVKRNGFNPMWEEKLELPFDCVADMLDLVFVRFVVKDDRALEDEQLGVYCISLGSLQQGYRHLPLHDAQLSQYLFSSLFVHIELRTV